MAERIGRERVGREDGYLYYLGKDGYVWRTPMRANARGRKARIGKERVSRQEGYLYFIDKSGYVARTKMNRGGRMRGSRSSRRSASKARPARKAKMRRRR
ncbi:MAG: hypothetical protein M1390_01055 [Candidatus Marsarchaeota archaeon]|jgi:hypothetical protein|nr:hypothetical protein [Candidatus Marsarchaeota archaeon]